MKNNITTLALSSLAIGAFLTIILLGHTQIKNINDCEHQPGVIAANKQINVVCWVQDLGYPSVALNTKTGYTVAGNNVGISSTPKLNKAGLIADIAIWSGVSFVVLGLISMPIMSKSNRKK